MALETVEFIDDLVITNPTGSDLKSTADDHLRNIKKSLKASLNGFTGNVLLYGSDAGTANTYAINPTTALTAYNAGMIVLFTPANANTGASTLNISSLGAKTIKNALNNDPASGEITTKPQVMMYDGTNFVVIGGSGLYEHIFDLIDLKANIASPTFTGTVTLPADTSIGSVTATEIAYLDATSSIQTQLDSKAPLASPSLTGTPTAPTATTGTDTTQIATTQFVNATAMGSALPAQTGNSGKMVTTDGSNASWSDTMTDFNFFIDEDNMASDSANKIPSQQSVKAYADTKATLVSGATADNIATLDANGDLTDSGKPITQGSNLPVTGLITGTMSVSSTTETLVQSNTTYTGTGASQSINTGIESKDINYSASTAYTTGELAFDRITFKLYEALQASTGQTLAENSYWTKVADDVVKEHKNSMVWIKSRGAVRSHMNFDTLRGVGNYIRSDLTDAENYISGILDDFTVTGFTLGSNANVNNSAETYIAWQQAYHKVFITTTNDGKRALVAIDDVSGRGMCLYQPDATNSQDIDVGITDIQIITDKRLDTTGNWDTSIITSNDQVILNDSIARTGDAVRTVNGSVITVPADSTGNRIMYFEANSDNIAIGTYSGTGASGNEIYTGFKPSRVILKRINSTDNWYIEDNVTGATHLQANTTATSGTGHTTFNSTNFEVDTSSGWNDLGGEFLYIAYADTKANSGGSYSDLPSLTSNLQLSSDSILGYSNGADTYGAVNTAVDVSGTPTPTYSQGENWVKRDASGNWTTTRSEPVIGKPDGFGDFYYQGKWYEPSNLVTNGDLRLEPFANGWQDLGTDPAVWTDNSYLSLVRITGGTTPYVQTQISVTSGVTYNLKVDLKQDSDRVYIRVGTTSQGSDVISSDSDNGLIYRFTHNSTATLYVNFYPYSDGYTSKIDNISVTPVDNTSWTAYNPIISYLPYSVQADVDGNVAQINDDKVPDVHYDKLSVTDIVGLNVPIYYGHAFTHIDGSNEIFAWDSSPSYSGGIDNFNAMRGGVYTAPKSGYYSVQCTLFFNHGNSTPTSIRGALIAGGASNSIEDTGNSASGQFTNGSLNITEYLEKGDTIYMISTLASATHFFYGSSYTALSIQYLGNDFTTEAN